MYSWEADALLCSLFKTHRAEGCMLWLLRKLLKQVSSDAYVHKQCFAIFDARTQKWGSPLKKQANKQVTVQPAVYN